MVVSSRWTPFACFLFNVERPTHPWICLLFWAHDEQPVCSRCITRWVNKEPKPGVPLTQWEPQPTEGKDPHKGTKNRRRSKCTGRHAHVEDLTSSDCKSAQRDERFLEHRRNPSENAYRGLFPCLAASASDPYGVLLYLLLTAVALLPLLPLIFYSVARGVNFQTALARKAL